MSRIESIEAYFVEQRFPYGEISGMFRLITKVVAIDGKPVKILTDDLYTCKEALILAETFRQNRLEPANINADDGLEVINPAR